MDAFAGWKAWNFGRGGNFRPFHKANIDSGLGIVLKRICILFVGRIPMRNQEASRTADFMAVFRASEHAKAPTARAFSDPLAAALLPGELRLAARLFGLRPAAALLNSYIDRRWPGARTSGIARTKLIDDWIVQAAREIDQVVLLGAGFDTRAWRLDALASARIFEVDHPSTATVKQERLRSAHADLRRVTFVKVDFEVDNFDEMLGAAGFDATRPAIVVWEGVSQYLSAEAVCGVMRWAGGLAPGSRFIFTYIHAGVLNGSVAFVGADKAIAKVHGSGEPWQFGLLPETLDAFLRERGLSLLSDLGADEYRARVMGAQSRHMQGYSFYHTVLAEVPGA
jgi:methyltransferase (TIGR00027 family)